MESGDDAGPDEQPAEPDTKQRPRLPSSLGLSVLLAAWEAIGEQLVVLPDGLATRVT